MQVANPSKTTFSHWTIGPAEMLSLDEVAKKEGISVAEVKELIRNGKIDPIPLILVEENVTWAIDPKYHVEKN